MKLLTLIAASAVALSAGAASAHYRGHVRHQAYNNSARAYAYGNRDYAYDNRGYGCSNIDYGYGNTVCGSYGRGAYGAYGAYASANGYPTRGRCGINWSDPSIAIQDQFYQQTLGRSC